MKRMGWPSWWLERRRRSSFRTGWSWPRSNWCGRSSCGSCGPARSKRAAVDGCSWTAAATVRGAGARWRTAARGRRSANSVNVDALPPYRLFSGSASVASLSAIGSTAENACRKMRTVPATCHRRRPGLPTPKGLDGPAPDQEQADETEAGGQMTQVAEQPGSTAGRLGSVVLDCPDPLELAQFYSALLGLE